MADTHFEEQPRKPADVLYYRFTSHKKILFHRHDRMEIICVRRGRIALETDSGRHMLTAGDIAVVNPCERHGSNELSSDNSYFVFLVPRSVFAACGREYTFRGTVKNDRECFACAEAVSSLFEKRNGSDGYLRRSEIYRLLHLLSRYAKKTDKAVPANENDSEITAGLKTLIRTGYADSFSVRELAHSFSVSVSNLQHTFKHDTGMSITGFINMTRTENAKRLLENTELSVSDIAQNVGFSDHNYFTRVFTSAVGQSPREYRRAHRKQFSFHPTAAL